MRNGCRSWHGIKLVHNVSAALALTFLMLSISCEKSIRKVNNKNLIKMNKMEQKADYKKYVPFVLRLKFRIEKSIKNFPPSLSAPQPLDF